MRLRPESTPDLLRFGTPASMRAAGRLVALAGVAGALCALTLPEFAGGQRLLVLAASAAALLAGWLTLLWDDRLEIRVPERTYRRARGFWPLRREAAGSLDEFERLALITHEYTNAYGERETRCALRLEGVGRSLVVCTDWPGEDPVASAARLAERTGLLFRPPEEQAGQTPGAVAAVARRGWILWAGMACATAAMMWPVLTGRQDRGARSREHDRRPGRRAELRASPMDQAEFLFFTQRDYPAAERKLREHLDTNPNDPQAHNLLAYALAEQGNLEGALEEAYRANKLAPENYMILDTVAEMHQRRKEWDKAIRWYRRAIAAGEDQGIAETWCKYGMTLLAAGRKAEARQYLDMAARNPYSPWQRTAAEVLAQFDHPANLHRPRPLGPFLPRGRNVL